VSRFAAGDFHGQRKSAGRPVQAVGGRSNARLASELPFWATLKEEPGAKVVNDVWLPKEYAEPLLAKAIAATAKAMSGGSGGGGFGRR
jgi:hypothetical protein